VSKQIDSFGGAVLAFLILVGVVAMFFGGCATTYDSCEDRAAKRGTVLECKQTLFVKSGKPVVRCLVSTPKGDEFHSFQGCR